MFELFHFLAPWWLLLFPCFLVIAVVVYNKKLNSTHWGEVCDPELLPFLEQKGDEQQRSIWLPFTFIIAGLLLSIAAAQPVWKQQPQPVFKQGDSVVIALDLSASMNATDIKPSRIQRAHFKIKDLLKRLPDTQVALVVYAANSFTVTPLTEDGDTILAQLSAMTPEIMPLQGSRADRALLRADQLLTQAGISKGNILFVSDEISPAQIAKDASRLKIAGRQISILAIGTKEGAPIETNAGLIRDSDGEVVMARTEINLMQESANLGGGYAAMITADDQDLDYLISRFQHNEEAPTVLDEKIQRWIAEGPLFILFALPFLLVVFRKGFLALFLPAVLIVGMSPSNDAEAGVWEDLWKTSDQQARQYYEGGETAKAADMFVDPRWKQVSHYRNGDYEKAISSLETPTTAADWYNRGNVLSRQGELEQALVAYDKALTQQPEFEDAQYNRDLIQKMLDQQKDQENQNGEGSGQDSKPKSDQEKSKEQKAGNKGSDDKDSDKQNSDEKTQNDDSKNNSSQNSKSDQEGSDNQKGQSENSDSQGSSTLDSTKDDTKRTQSKESTLDSEEQPIEQSSSGQKEQMAERLKQSLDEKLKQNNAEHSSDRSAVQSDRERHQPLDEKAEARQQMLNRIEDDPAGLWRRKFHYQYRQQGQGQKTEEKTW